MKKLLIFCLAVLLLLSLAACEKKTEETLNGDKPSTKPQETEPPATEPLETGYKVGNLCPSFQVEIGDGNGRTGEFIDPTASKKVTIINFWGTWCSPCKSELPHFDQIARDYDISLVAIHSVSDNKKMAEYIKKNYAESPIVFAYDEASEDSYLDKYFSLLGGSTGYPYTVILDAEGIVLHTQTGVMSYEQLQEIVEGQGLEKKAPVPGNQVGNLCTGGEIEIIDENGITGETVNPATTGKITVISFWGTWCDSGVEVLPNLHKIAGEYGDTVTVIAIHSGMVRDSAPEFIGETYADSAIQFAWDSEDSAYYTLLGSDDIYPYTFLLDENGVITNIFVGSVNEWELKDAIDSLKNP